MFIVNFFKTFAKGLLYVITLPVTVLVLAIYSVIGFVIFIGLSLKSIVLFFKGKTIFTNLPEDDEAQAILDKWNAQTINNQQNNNPNIVPPTTQQTNNNPIPLSLYPSESSMYKTEYSSPLFSPKVEENASNQNNINNPQTINQQVNNQETTDQTMVNQPVNNQINNDQINVQKEPPVIKNEIKREEEPEIKKDEITGTYTPMKESRSHWWSKK